MLARILALTALVATDDLAWSSRQTTVEHTTTNDDCLPNSVRHNHNSRPTVVECVLYSSIEVRSTPLPFACWSPLCLINSIYFIIIISYETAIAYAIHFVRKW